VLSPAVPRVYNSDGEDMEIFALHYRLEKGVTAKKLRAALEAAPDLDPASATFWNWLAPRKAPQARVKPKGRAAMRCRSLGSSQNGASSSFGMGGRKRSPAKSSQWGEPALGHEKAHELLGGADVAAVPEDHGGKRHRR
jgi:hypothetical protein